jgi:hypothetical protein
MLLAKDILDILLDSYFDSLLYYKLIFILTEIFLYIFIIIRSELFGVYFLLYIK